jgi:DNA-binding NarL/FixJ family response regulator
MIRTLVVADSGPAMASITASLSTLLHVEIVGYASGRAPVAAVVHSLVPDVVLVDQMRHASRALERITETRACEPGVAVVGLAERPESLWMGDALHAGANAVVPRDLDGATLALVLDEVLAPTAHSQKSAA